MKFAVLLFIATAVLFGIAKVTSRNYGADVGARFLETNTDYTAGSLKAWIENNRASAAGYAFPVLIPIDLLFMVFLAGFLSVVSVSLGGSIDRLRDFAWLFVTIPALYLAADLAEDTLLARLLTVPETVNSTIVGVVQTLTRLKIYSMILSAGQAAILFLAYLVWGE